MTVRTRFAPSPTGPLHLGHAYSAMLGFDMAVDEGGEWLLRIEDIDWQRSKPEWERQIYEDLEWLGLRWPEPVMRQSERGEAYEAALARLWSRGLIYECGCSRADIAAAISAPQEGLPARSGSDGLVYPGTCKLKHLDRSFAEPRPSADSTWRLHMDRTRHVVSEHRLGEVELFSFREAGQDQDGHGGEITFTVQDMIREVGDVVLARRSMGTSYHLSVVLDDAAQGITHVVRGQDLFEATKIHVVLQRLLGLPTPTYHHHRLVRDETGRRLAKREDAKAIRRLREEGATPEDVRRMVGL